MTKQTTPASFPRNRGACGTVQVILEQSADFAVASVVDVSGRLPSEFAPQCGRGSLPTLRQQPHLERLVPAGGRRMAAIRGDSDAPDVCHVPCERAQKFVRCPRS